MFGPSARPSTSRARELRRDVDLGGASACGMIWRAAAAIELGVCETVLVLARCAPPPPDEGRTQMSMPI